MPSNTKLAPPDIRAEVVVASVKGHEKQIAQVLTQINDHPGKAIEKAHISAPLAGQMVSSGLIMIENHPVASNTGQTLSTHYRITKKGRERLGGQ